MKKFILFISLSLVATLGSAQVIFYVEAPSPNEGNYDFTYAEPPNWGVADLTDPLNAVTDTMVMASDGTAGDSLACNPLTNNVNGKIAVLYRGSCEFGVKALNCQNAGAVAVIVINNAGGAPIAMGAGAQGNNVTIPVVMISDVTGALLKAEIEAGNTTAFIGSKSGFYGDDLGCYPEHILMAEHFGNIQALSQNASEFNVQLGAWVFNYGSNDQTNVTLNCTVELNSSVIYDNTSTPTALLQSGDSVFILLPDFTQATYANGYYDVTYTIAADATDEFTDDNVREADFMMSDSLFSFSRIDPGTNKAIGDAYYRGGSTLSSNNACLVFNDPNASRMAVHGITYSAVTTQNPTPTSIDGEYVEVFAYKWDDSFTDYSDAAFTLLTPLSSGSYIYTADLQEENIFIPFQNDVTLSDNQNYLFCVAHYGANIYTGYDTKLDYNWNFETYGQQPIFPTEADGTWYALGFGTTPVPAFTVNMYPWAVGIEEQVSEEKIIAYPNPANVLVNIPVGKDLGAVSLTITDLTGKVVSTQNVEMDGPILTVDVTTLASGSYVFNLQHGNTSDVFTVNVTR